MSLIWLCGASGAAIGEVAQYQDSSGVTHFSNAERALGAPQTALPPRSRHPSPAPGTPEQLEAGAAGATRGQSAPSARVAGARPVNRPPAAIIRLIEQTAVKYHLELALLMAIVRAESGYDPSAVSRNGAGGLMQLMPATAASLGVRDVFHPGQNLTGGALYYRRLLHRFSGDQVLALAAFNAGPTAVEAYGGVPPFAETRAYIGRVQMYRQEFLRSREVLPHMVRQKQAPAS